MQFHCLIKSTHSLVPAMQLSLWQMLFFVYLSVKTVKNSLFSAGMISNIFSQSYLRAISMLSTVSWSSPQGTWLPSFHWNHAGPLHWGNVAAWTCLAGRSDCSIHTSKTLTCQGVGNKSQRAQESSTSFSEIPSGWITSCCICPSYY